MKKKLTWFVALAVVAVGSWAFISRDKEEEGEVEYKYSKIEKGDVIRSISATGQLVSMTTVDVKSKAGGRVVQLAVDEGSVVKKGELIAIIDPSDTRSTYEQAAADVTSAQARAAQAESNYRLQVASSQTGVEDAKAAVESAKIRLQKAQLEAARQPLLTSASVMTAQASYDAALADLNRVKEVDIPARRRDSQSELTRAQSAMEMARSDFERQTDLLARGYVAKSVVERAKSNLDAAVAAHDVARQRANTLEKEIDAIQRSSELAVERARANLDEAKANSTQNDISRQNLAEARQAVRVAEINLRKAMDARINNQIRQNDVVAAKASSVRSRVSLENAKVQLESTTVVAPRDGVVTQKYLEEGTIIPPGTSTFAQGTSLVQISDVTQMFVECNVDEADVAAVREGQRVRITTEAFPGQRVRGVVQRVNPAAKTDQNITSVKVRVRVMPDEKVKLLPGMNATCEFITLFKRDVLVVPAQAVQNEGGKAYVRIKTNDPLKPQRKEIEVGETGNDGIEVKSGLAEGDEVVVAELNLAQLRETQRRMQEAREGGGLAGGTMPGRRNTAGGGGRATGGGGAGGAGGPRGAGGAGGGR